MKNFPEAGSLMAQQIPFQNELMIGYNVAGNTVIEAVFSLIYDNEKEITRSHLFVISGYYDRIISWFKIYFRA